MSSLLTTLGSVMTAVWAGVGDVVEVLTASGNELLLIPTGIAFAYACVKIFRRFIVSI